jgi:hypothetical protein
MGAFPKGRCVIGLALVVDSLGNIVSGRSPTRDDQVIADHRSPRTGAQCRFPSPEDCSSGEVRSDVYEVRRYANLMVAVVPDGHRFGEIIRISR